jgi:cullin-associated NEDD8-dissociated protein 1
MATSDLCDALKKHALTLHSTSSKLSSLTSKTDISSDMNTTQMIDAASEKKICESILRLVDDSSNDVQAIAVKTLGILVTCVHEDQVVAIAARLGALVLDETKSALRDVYTIGLRTLVKTVPMNMGDIVSNRLAAELMDGIRKRSQDILSPSATVGNKAAKEKSQVAEEITLACLEILTELLTRFGALSFITRQHEILLEVTMRQLASESQLVRKRAGTTIGCLAVVISDPILYRLVESLLSQIDRAEIKSGRRKSRRLAKQQKEQDTSGEVKPKDTRALIRTMCTVAGLVGHRLGQEQIDRLVPIFSRFCDPADAVSGDDLYDDDDDDSNDNGEGEENDDMEEEQDEAAIILANELREACLSGFESFVMRRPVQIQPHLPQIIHAALAFMRHDPNYSYGDENVDDKDGGDNDGENGSEEDDDYDMDGEDEEYEDDDFDDDSDDDDDSWKVRRSAIRTLTAVVKTSAKDPSKLWKEEFCWRKNKKWKTTVGGALVKRFKERDENCRVDIIECFTHLLTNTVEAASRGDIILTTPDSMDVTSDASQTVIDLRTKVVPSSVKGCEKQLSAKKAGNRTKSAALALLSALCKAPGGIGNAEQLNTLFEYIKVILGDTASGNHATNKTLKLDSLQLVHVIITSTNHSPEDVKNTTINILLPELCGTLRETWYKITSETLRVLAEIPTLLAEANASDSEKSTVSKALYEAIEPRLAIHDADQEIKECSLVSTASLLSVLHGSLERTATERLLALILLRLKSETTRIPTIKTISTIVGAVDMTTIINDVVTELSSLLRQNSRSVKQNSLQCLDTIVKSRASGLNDGIFGLVLKELSNIIVDSDLHISHLSLQVCLSILNVSVSSEIEIKENLLPALLNLSKSPLLQDKALDSLLAVFEKLVSRKAVVFQELLIALNTGLPGVQESHVHGGGTRQSIANIAKCIAAITAAATEPETNAVVSELLTSLESLSTTQSAETSPKIQLALRVAGDLGRIVSLGSMPGVAERLQNIYMAMFESPFEDIKNSAAYGLGRSCVCSKPEFLPKILSALEENDQKKQYLLLSSLRELIFCHQQGFGGDITSSIDQILPHLNIHLADKEEGVRTMVADCMGCLACLEPGVILPRLQNLVVENGNGKEPTVCATVATAMKYAIAGKCDTQQTLPFMPTFLGLLNEQDLDVKNASLLMIYSAVHHNPQLVLVFMEETIVPALHQVRV